MPAPIAIRDPATYYETRKDPSYGLGEDPVVPLRNFLAMQKTDISCDESTQTTKRHMEDISMSPRVLGYVFSCLSCAVATISSFIFYFRGTTQASPNTLFDYATSIGINLTEEQMDKATKRIGDINNTYRLYFGSGGNLVQEWKLYGCIAISGLLTIITFAIVIAHFDSICCVKKNRISFRDGSVLERNLLLVLIVLSVIALHTSTSKYSIGEAQANVFFSSWTNFVSVMINYEVWRKGSGKQHSFHSVLFGKKRHWFLLAICKTVVFLSTVDFFINNNIVQDNNNLDCLDLRWNNEWIWLSLTGTIVCWSVVLLHRYCKPILFVRIVEVIVSLAVVVVDGYVVNEFVTGGRLDQVACPSNLYFSVWCSFFLAVWIFSTLIQKGRGLVGDE